MSEHMTLGQKLRSIRKEREYTIEDVAYKSGLHHNTICLYEHDKATPSLMNMAYLAKVYGVTIDDLLGRTDRVFSDPEDKGQSFAEKLVDLRERHFWTRKAAATKIGLHVTTLASYEGDKALPTIFIADDIATTYGVSIEYLAGITRVSSGEQKRNIMQIDF